MLVNAKGDGLDIISSFKKSIKERYVQAPYGFFRNTFLENIKFIKKFRRYDKTLYDLPIAEKLLTKLGATDTEFLENGIKLNGTLVSKIVSKALLRIPVLSLLFFAHARVSCYN